MNITRTVLPSTEGYSVNYSLALKSEGHVVRLYGHLAVILGYLAFVVPDRIKNGVHRVGDVDILQIQFLALRDVCNLGRGLLVEVGIDPLQQEVAHGKDRQGAQDGHHNSQDKRGPEG